jgi:hypothetical protein
MGMLGGCATFSVGRVVTYPFISNIHEFIISPFTRCALPQ